MVTIEFILFWAPIAFGFVVAASYIGTKFALYSYFDDEEFTIADMFRVGDGGEEQ